jgi:uncharacterized protein (DUF697 family)
MKKLPRAILRSSEAMRAGSAAPAIARQAGGGDAEEDPRDAGGLPRNVIEIPPRAATAPASVAPASTSPPPLLDERLAALRRSRGVVIVERHATYAAFGGMLPLPWVNVSGVVAIILRMVKRLSAHYGVAFDRELARAMVIASVGGAMPTGLASATGSALVYLLPSTGLIGLAVSSVTAAAVTRAIGLVFIEQYESGVALADDPEMSQPAA